jgi:4-hydroxy-tetrahydrodipicolinate synthase
MIRAAQAGDWKEARRIHHHLLPLHSAMFLQTNPIPVKAAIGMMGLVSGDVRLPLCSMPDELNAKLRGILQQYALID